MGRPVFDLIVKNGRVVDGTGAVQRRADVGVRSGRVAAIGSLAGASSDRTIDADGLIVAPGVIDAHTHYDPQLTFDPYASTSCYHGVTTVVAGNCGFSVAPTPDRERGFIQAMFARVEEMSPDAMSVVAWADCTTFPEYRQSRTNKLGVNLACYIGHSTLRRSVLGADGSQRAATDDEIQSMADIVREAMNAGAAGFSSSLSPNHLDGDERPTPARFSSHQEILTLAAAAGELGRGSIVFLPPGVVRGYTEEDQDFLLKLAKVSGLPIIIQGVGGRNKIDAPLHGWDRALEFFARSRDEGLPVYSLLQTRVDNLTVELNERNMHYRGVPAWHEMLRLPFEERVAYLRNPESREILRDACEHYNIDPEKGSTHPPPLWPQLWVERVANPEHASLVGRSIEDIAAEQGKAPADAMLDLALAENLATEFCQRNENPEWIAEVKEAQLHPHMLVGTSDAGAHLGRQDTADVPTYYLRTWVLDRQVCSLEEGVRQITQVPASVLGFTDRGTLEIGKWADIFIFDPDTVGPGGTRWEENALAGAAGRYVAKAEGVAATIVNGVPIVIDNKLTTDLPGRWVAPGAGLGELD
jgi:N-acyl-D-amino-acid deacylase